MPSNTLDGPSVSAGEASGHESAPDGLSGLPVLAVDTGGTFTDFVLYRGGQVSTLKVPSTPADPSEAVLEGVRQLMDEHGPFLMVHGSTVGTNALLERKGARVVLVTNRGFEDVIEIGRQNRPQLYALAGHRPPPLVARADRVGIHGRLGPQGEEVEALDPGEVEALTARDAKAWAVALLHAYADPSHEAAVADRLRAAGHLVSVSSEILPEYREYERTSTTVVNAYIAPVVSGYLGRLEEEAGARAIRIMGSNGGALPVARAREEPVHTVLSGPAGGVVGALAWARRAGFRDIVTFDMGGTSTDVSLCPGQPLRTREFTIGGQPAAIPVIDIHTVGAGGGSLARVDPGGALRVGPQSAGAAPGPICYGRGGGGLTVTDAHVWLGRLPADGFLGGSATLDRGAVETPLAELAGRLGSTMEDAAAGILAVVNSSMERALRVISVERGHDPAAFVVVAFGGAGGLHVAELSERLGAAGAMIPPDPGLLSAYGMLAAPVTKEVSRTVLVAHDDAACDAQLAEVFAELEETATTRMAEEGHGRASLAVERWVDARYLGQSYELPVLADGWVERFHQAHAQRYGYRQDDARVEAVTLRVVARAAGLSIDPPPLESAAEATPPARTTRVHAGGRLREAACWWRRDLRAGHVLPGPGLVLEYSSTTWIPSGWRAQVDETGNLLLQRTD